MEKHMPYDLQSHGKPIMRSRHFSSAVNRKYYLLGLIFKFFCYFEKQLSFSYYQFSVLKVSIEFLKCAFYLTRGFLAIHCYSKIFRGILCYVRNKKPCFTNNPITVIEFSLFNKLHEAEESCPELSSLRELVGAQPRCSLHQLFIPLASVLCGGLSDASGLGFIVNMLRNSPLTSWVCGGMEFTTKTT